MEERRKSWSLYQKQTSVDPVTEGSKYLAWVHTTVANVKKMLTTMVVLIKITLISSIHCKCP